MTVRSRDKWQSLNVECLRLVMEQLGDQLTGRDQALKKYESQIAAIQKNMETSPAYETLQALFGLSGDDRNIVLYAALADQNPNLARALQSHKFANKGRATLAVITDIIPDAAARLLSEDAPLRRHNLVHFAGTNRLRERPIYCEPEILSYLQGQPQAATILSAYRSKPFRPQLHCSQDMAVHVGTCLVKALRDREVTGLYTRNPDAAMWGETLAAIAYSIGSELWHFPAELLPDNARDVETFLTYLRRDLVLLNAIPVFTIRAGNSLPPQRASFFWRSLEKLARPFMLLGSGVPDDLNAMMLSLDGLMEAGEIPKLDTIPEISMRDVAQVKAQFKLNETKLRRCVKTVEYNLSPDLWSAAMGAQSQDINRLAQHIYPLSRVEDLVLPVPQMHALERMATFLKNRDLINHEWGFADKSSRGLGMAGIFFGPSGTGKTTAAEVVVSLMSSQSGQSVNLYRVNTSALISKYIGETSKNIARIFKAGEEAGAALLFDEAEGLFAKRTTSARDSLDKHSNAELGFLLQCLESYSGVAILTTNMRQVIDDAFLRRFRFAIEFPFPDRTLREHIWRRVIPDNLPCTDLDWTALAKLSLSGGSIRSIAINAAYTAADLGRPVDMEVIAQAARLEYAKLEKPSPETELRRWAA